MTSRAHLIGVALVLPQITLAERQRIVASRKDLPMLAQRLRLFIVLLSSWPLLGAEATRIDLGLVNVQTVAVSKAGESRMSPGIVVRVTNRSTRTQSLGISNEAGILVLPLPPGRYCYDAFSEQGVALTMRRPPRDRCFSIAKDAIETIGVEFLQ